MGGSVSLSEPPLSVSETAVVFAGSHACGTAEHGAEG